MRRLVAEQRGVDGANRWAEIAKYLPGRNGKQCRERWHNQLDPAIRKDAWTAEEDATLIAKQVWTCLAHKHLGALGGAAMRHAHERAISIIARACTLFGLSPRASRARAATMCQRPTNTATTASDSPATPPPCKLFAPPPTSSSIVPLDVLTRSLVRTLVYCPLSPLPSLASPLRAPPTVARGRRNSAISGPRSRNSFPVAPTTRSKTTGTRG